MTTTASAMPADSTTPREPITIALLGSGVVGTSVARELTQNAADFEARIGAPLQIVGVAVRDTSKDRSETGLPADAFTTDAQALVDGADITVEADKLAGVKVAAEVVKAAKGPKITIMKYKNKTGYRKRQGHRQPLTQIKVTKIG